MHVTILFFMSYLWSTSTDLIGCQDKCEFRVSFINNYVIFFYLNLAGPKTFGCILKIIKSTEPTWSWEKIAVWALWRLGRTCALSSWRSSWTATRTSPAGPLWITRCLPSTGASGSSPLQPDQQHQSDLAASSMQVDEEPTASTRWCGCQLLAGKGPGVHGILSRSADQRCPYLLERRHQAVHSPNKAVSSEALRLLHWEPLRSTLLAWGFLAMGFSSDAAQRLGLDWNPQVQDVVHQRELKDALMVRGTLLCSRRPANTSTRPCC